MLFVVAPSAMLGVGIFSHGHYSSLSDSVTRGDLIEEYVTPASCQIASNTHSAYVADIIVESSCIPIDPTSTDGDDEYEFKCVSMSLTATTGTL